MKLLRDQGWKPHVVCEFAKITKETLRYWRNKLHPKVTCKFYFTYDILIYLLINELVNANGVQLDRLKDFNWEKLLVELSKLTLVGMEGKIINFNMKKNKFKIYESLDEFKYLKGYNQHLDLGEHAYNLLYMLMNYGLPMTHETSS